MNIEDIFPHLPLSTRIRLVARGLVTLVHPSYILRVFLPLSIIIELGSVGGNTASLVAYGLAVLLTLAVLEIYLFMSSFMKRQARKFSFFDKASAALIPLAYASVHLMGWVQFSQASEYLVVEAVVGAGATLLIWAAGRGLVAWLPDFVDGLSAFVRSTRKSFLLQARRRAESKANGSFFHRMRQRALQEISDPKELIRLSRMAIGSDAQAGVKGSGHRRL